MKGDDLATSSQDEVFEGLAVLMINLSQENSKLLGVFGL